MHKEDEENKKRAAYRAKIVEKLHYAQDRRMIPDASWFEVTIDQLEIGKIRPRQAIHALHRKHTRYRIQTLLESPTCYIGDIPSMLNAGTVPPKPAQCRLGISTARFGGILTLFGPSGTGKTTCALRAAAYLASVGACDSFVAVSGTRIGRMRPSDLSDLIDACSQADFVLLDDIDKGSKSETRSSALLEILDTRERKWHTTTIVTSNMAGAELADQIESQTEGYGLPIVNRMRRGISLDFGGDIVESEAKAIIIESLRKKFLHNDDFDVDRFGHLDWRHFGMDNQDDSAF